jgi:4-hydroxy-tetrahydrodipicolinate synthase
VTGFSGVGVALLTLFDADAELDAPATAGLAVRLVDAGVKAVVVAGTTGEAATLDAAERVSLLRAVRAAVPSSTPVLAGTGAPSARQAVRLTSDALDHGADAVLVLSPPGSSDVRPYYDAVAEAAGGPERVLAYHFPAVSAPGIPVSTLRELPVAGCKDSSGDAGRLLEEITTFSGSLYTGSAALLSYAGPLGCTGAILSLANLDPEACLSAFAGDVEAQRALAEPNRFSHERFPAGLKEMVALRFGTSTVARGA